MNQDEYLIHQIANLAGVSTRTIRYYAQEGLLPEPVIQGKYAYYNDEHLERLKLILQLKNNYLPLKEIRQIITSLSTQEVQDLLKSKEKEGIPGSSHLNNNIPQVSDSARDYIARLLKTQPEAVQPAPRLMPPLPTKVKQVPQIITDPAGEKWQRIHLAPGVELHFKEPLTHQEQTRLDELIQTAKKIYSK
jgi:DNA-binding transcriptional MerR regulator